MELHPAFFLEENEEGDDGNDADGEYAPEGPDSICEWEADIHAVQAREEGQRKHDG